jgi:hypothetical protein
MAELQALLITFEALKGTINALRAQPCSCTCYECISKGLTYTTSPLSYENLSAKLAESYVECERCTSLESNYMLFQEMRIQVHDLIKSTFSIEADFL